MSESLYGCWQKSNECFVLFEQRVDLLSTLKQYLHIPIHTYRPWRYPNVLDRGKNLQPK